MADSIRRPGADPDVAEAVAAAIERLTGGTRVTITRREAATIVGCSLHAIEAAVASGALAEVRISPRRRGITVAALTAWLTAAER